MNQKRKEREMNSKSKMKNWTTRSSRKGWKGSTPRTKSAMLRARSSWTKTAW
jgi:hypothetical protein